MPKVPNQYKLVLDRICDLLDRKNLTQKDLCDYLGLSNKSFSEWKAGRGSSYMKKLPEIAEFLGESIDYLWNDTKDTDEKSPSDNGEGNITKKHMQILDAYDRSQPAIQYAVDKLLGIEEKPQTFKVKIAARNGEFIEKEMTKEEIDAIKNLPDLDGDL